MGPGGAGGSGGTWEEVTLGCFLIARGKGTGTGGVTCVTPGDAAFPLGCRGRAVTRGFGGAWGGGGAGTGGGGGGNGGAAAAAAAAAWLIFGCT